MKVPEKTWIKYIEALREIDDRAAEMMEEYLRTHALATVAEKLAASEYALALAERFGEGAAAMACEMYDAMALASGRALSAAEPAATATLKEVKRVVFGIAEKYDSARMIPAAVGRLVKRTGVDTTMQNAIRDGAEWAWIPHGDTCAFCITLASRGWQKASKAALKGNHAEHIHANCDCTYAIRFDRRTEYAGYDPDKYLEMYENAEGHSAREKINSLKRAQYAKDAPKMRAQKRAAYAERTGNESSGLTKTIIGGTITKNRRLPLEYDLQFFSNKSKQYGKKIGKHAADFGLDPSSDSDRIKMREIIADIHDNKEELRQGFFRGQKEEVLFYIKGRDVVVTKQNGEFITVMKDGTNNPRVKNARKL